MILKKAEKTDWKITPMPSEAIVLPPVDVSYSASEYEPRKVSLPHQRDMALFLIDRILLGRNVAFPVDPNVKISSAKDYWMLRHGAVGNSVSTKDQQNDQT